MPSEWVPRLAHEPHVGDLMAYKDRQLMWLLICRNEEINGGWHAYLMHKDVDAPYGPDRFEIETEGAWFYAVDRLDITPKDRVEYLCPHEEAR
jgi:hypothetical protein